MARSLLTICACGLVFVCTAGSATRAVVIPSRWHGPNLPWVAGFADAKANDLALFVPAYGRLDSVWYVPAGSSDQQIAVAWQYRAAASAWYDQRRWVLTLWSPTRRHFRSASWIPHNLIRSSPFPIDGQSVTLADVTGDKHDDLLVTVFCIGCNHGAKWVSIYATSGGRDRRILGNGYSRASSAKSPSVGGRELIESSWGVQEGMVWFDRGGIGGYPRRDLTFLRWTGRGWRTVARRSVPAIGDKRAAGVVSGAVIVR